MKTQGTETTSEGKFEKPIAFSTRQILQSQINAQSPITSRNQAEDVNKLTSNASNIYKNYNDIAAKSSRNKDLQGIKNRSEYGIKIEKNLVKDTGTTKTLETLNRSIEKNSHMRSFTMSSMVMGGMEFSGETKSKNTNFSSSNTQVSPFKQANQQLYSKNFN